MKRNPKEYPPRHMCVWEPKSTIEGPRKEYIHHTLFTETTNRFSENSPRIDELNQVTFGKKYPLPINLSAGDFKTWEEISGKRMIIGKMISKKLVIPCLSQISSIREQD